MDATTKKRLAWLSLAGVGAGAAVLATRDSAAGRRDLRHQVADSRVAGTSTDLAEGAKEAARRVAAAAAKAATDGGHAARTLAISVPGSVADSGLPARVGQILGADGE